MFEAVIFDWDGTLAKTKEIVLQSFHKALDELSIEVDERLIPSLLGNSAKEIFINVLRNSEIGFNEKTIKKLVEKRIKAELELSSCVELRDGAFDLLNELKGKIKLALATMNNKQVIELMLNSCGFSRFFDITLSADEVSKPKPEPDIFLKCASQLGIDPSVIVVIEDSKFGVRAAKKANMKCIAVLSGVSKKKELEGENPDLIVDSIEEKEEILKFIFR